MKKVNEYVMHVLCINAKSNAKWISHVIVSAKTLEEAKEAAQKNAKK